MSYTRSEQSNLSAEGNSIGKHSRFLSFSLNNIYRRASLSHTVHLQTIRTEQNIGSRRCFALRTGFREYLFSFRFEAQVIEFGEH